MIYDAIMYCGEENILDIRLNTIGDFCDKIIILEGSKSHTGIPRELEFEKQKNRFSKFLHKIEYYGLDYYQNGEPTYNDFRARLILQEILIKNNKITEFDRVIHSDNDEVVRPEILKQILENDKSLDKPYTFMMNNRILCLDLEPEVQPGQFPGAMLLKGKHVMENYLHDLRANRQNIHKKDCFNLIENAGWHFSYGESIERTVNKFKFYCHAAQTSTWTKDKESLINCIKTKTGFTPDKPKLEVVEWKEENFPAEIWNNPIKYQENLSWNY